MDKIIPVTPEKYKEIKPILKKGALLVSNVEFDKARFYWITNGRLINKKELCQEVDLKNNREWILRKPNQYRPGSLEESAPSLHEKLKCGDFIFEISGLFVVGTGYHYLPKNETDNTRTQTLYVPEGFVNQALQTQLQQAVQYLDRNSQAWLSRPTGLTQSHIEQMVDYALNDLKTGKILRENIKAGQMADVMFEIGSIPNLN